MPNLVVGADGTVEAETIIQHGTLEKNQPNSVLGRSLIIHAGEDDNVTDPAGNSGDRGGREYTGVIWQVDSASVCSI